MIVDTSALVAITCGEDAWEQLRLAINSNEVTIPAPVLTELWLVLNGRHPGFVSLGEEIVANLLADGASIVAFEPRHAQITAAARQRFGKGNGHGGKLNFGDLMVYAIAKERNLPLLCTGNDFASTDLIIHPASRIDP